MYRLTEGSNNLLGVFDTSDNIIEYYSVEEVLHICVDLEISIEGCKNGLLYDDLNRIDYGYDFFLAKCLKPSTFKYILMYKDNILLYIRYDGYGDLILESDSFNINLDDESDIDEIISSIKVERTYDLITIFILVKDKLLYFSLKNVQNKDYIRKSAGLEVLHV